MARYHVIHGSRRTTVTLPDLLVGLLAIQLGYEPDGAGAHGAVRAWLQQRLENQHDPGRIRVSQWLKDEATLAVTDRKLSRAYSDWILSTPE